MIARNNRHTCLFHQCFGGILQPHGANSFGRWADEDKPRRLDGIHETGIFGEKPIARMDCLRAGFLRSLDDSLDIQIALRRNGRADAHRLIGHLDMKRIGIRIGINCDGGNTQFPRRANDPAGNFSAIGNQYLLNI